MAEITVGISNKTKQAMQDSGLDTKTGRPVVDKEKKPPSVVQKLNKANATQNNFTANDIDAMTPEQLMKYLDLPDKQARGGKVHTKTYARGGGIRKARTYG